MASNKSEYINMAFNMFAYAVLERRDVGLLDRAIRKKIKAEDPYARLTSVPKGSLEEYGRFLGPVARAVGIPLSALGQTYAETMRDLSRRASSMEAKLKSIGASLSFDAGGVGLGEVVCRFAGDLGSKMTLRFEVDTSRTRGRWISGARAVFYDGEMVAEFQLKVKNLQQHYEGLMRQFGDFSRFEEALAVFGAGDEGVAEHLVESYKQLGFQWREQEVSPEMAIRNASFGDESYVVTFDDDEQKASVSSIWCGKLRFEATYDYTDFMELDFATICDVDGYEHAVSEQEALNRLGESLMTFERELDEAIRKVEGLMVDAAGALGADVEDLSTAGSRERPVERVHVGDLIVRARTSTCGFENHEIREVIALVNVFDPKRGVTEVAVDAFCCPTCKRYYVLERNFDRLAKRGSLCCRVVVRPGQVQEFVPSNYGELAERSFYRQLGYNASKEEGLSDSERRAILDFAIENGFKTQKQTISFLEWLARFHGSQKKNADAVRKWESDIKYLISNKGTKASRVKIDRVFLTEHKWGKAK